MDDTISPEDACRIIERVNLARPILDQEIIAAVQACAASGYTPRQIIDATPLSRQRIYQILAAPPLDPPDGEAPFVVQLVRLIERR